MLRWDNSIDNVISRWFFQITGVNPIKEFLDLEDIKIYNYKECRSLCCNLKERSLVMCWISIIIFVFTQYLTRCTTWQYQNSTNTCFIQERPVRLGMEGSDTILWCDPFPPHAWHGYRLQSRINGICTWGEDLPNQCFGFGAERMHPMDKSRMNETQCAEMCCKDPTCDSWQEMPGRGCYYGTI